jgi:phage-related protein
MPVFVPIIDHDWTLEANHASGGAGSTTGAGKDGNWTDPVGGIWDTNGGVLRGKPNPASAIAYKTNVLLRPAGENHADGRVVITTGLSTLPKAAWYAYARLQIANNEAYVFGYEATGFLRIYWFAGGAGATTTLASKSFPFNAGDQYEVTCDFLENTPTTLIVTVVNLTQGTSATLSVTDSTATNLQGTGRFAIGINDVLNTAASDYCNISRIRTYYTFSLSADVDYLLANTAGQVVNFSAGANPPYTPGTPGSPTFTKAGVSGVTMAQVVDDANHWHATFDTTGSGVGQLTITDPSDGATCVLPVVTEVDMTDANLLSGESPYNWETISTTSQSANAGAYKKIAWNGTQLALRLDMTGLDQTVTLPNGLVGTQMVFHFTPMLRYWVDDGPDINLQLPFTAVSSSDVLLPLVSGLAPGNHTLTYIIEGIYHSNSFDSWTDPDNCVLVKSVQIDGVTLAPNHYAKNVIAFGDSEIVGYFMRNIANPVTGNDAQHSWAMLLGRKLGAEVGLVGWPGSGYNRVGLGNVPKFGTHWPLYRDGSSRLVTGKFSPIPDYLLLAHGQNDMETNQTDAQTISDVTTQLPLLRAACNASTLIVVVIPAGGAKRAAITSAVNSYKLTSGDRQCLLVDLGTDVQAGLIYPGTLTGSISALDSIHYKDWLHALIMGEVYSAIRLHELTTGTTATTASNLRFGTYSLPPTLYIADAPHSRTVPLAKLPRADGARVPTGFLKEKIWSIRGGLVNSTISTGGGASLRTQLDALKAALAAGPTNFTIEDRFYRNCQVSDYGDTFGVHHQRQADVAFSIVTGDPFAYSALATSLPTNAVSASPTTVSATAGGNAYAQPALSVTVGGSGAITLAATITNTTTGEVFTLVGAVTGGDVIIVDSLNHTVTIGGVDKTLLLGGQFPTLAPGANVFTVAYSSGTITNLGLEWNDRWYS